MAWDFIPQLSLTCHSYLYDIASWQAICIEQCSIYVNVRAYITPLIVYAQISHGLYLCIYCNKYWIVQCISLVVELQWHIPLLGFGLSFDLSLLSVWCCFYAGHMHAAMLTFMEAICTQQCNIYGSVCAIVHYWLNMHRYPTLHMWTYCNKCHMA